MVLRKITLALVLATLLSMISCGKDDSSKESKTSQTTNVEVAKVEPVKIDPASVDVKSDAEKIKKTEVNNSVDLEKDESNKDKVTAVDNIAHDHEHDLATNTAKIPTPSAHPFNIEGKYEVLKNPQPVDNPDKVEVLGFFAYSCGHCYNFHSKYLDHWASPDDVDFRNIPLMFGASVAVSSRAYYTAEVLGIEKKYHSALFNEYRKFKQKYQKPEAAAELATIFGVTKQDFLDTYNSFAVEMKFNRSTQLAKAYQMHSVPTVIVNGKYRIKASGHAETLKVMDELIKRERAKL